MEPTSTATVVADNAVVRRAAIEPALGAAVACGFVSGVVGLFDSDPVTLAWITPLATALVQRVLFVGAVALINEDVWRYVVRGFWLAARAGVAAIAPSIVCNLIWPVTVPGSAVNAVIVGGMTAAIALPIEFAVLAVGQRQIIVASQ